MRHWPVVMLSALLLASCAAVAPPSRVLPPLNLLQDCAEPSVTAATNAQLLDFTLRLRDALRSCNRDKEALREWAR
jgi:hypothetical protein